MGLGGGGPLNDQDKSNRCPPWLKPLLQETFYYRCTQHAHSPKNECNMFCLDCVDGPLCSFCLSAHKHHRTIQIRKSSYHDVVRVSEIQHYVDVTEVQTYVINNAKVVFLKERPQFGHGSKVDFSNKRPQIRLPKAHVVATCQVCERSLLDSFRFCSLGCKMNHCPSSIARASEGRNKGLQGLNLSTSLPGIHRKRRRKGIPHRAPTGGLTI